MKGIQFFETVSRVSQVVLFGSALGQVCGADGRIMDLTEFNVHRMLDFLNSEQHDSGKSDKSCHFYFFCTATTAVEHSLWDLFLALLILIY